jgi:hypothetical protein
LLIISFILKVLADKIRPLRRPVRITFQRYDGDGITSSPKEIKILQNSKVSLVDDETFQDHADVKVKNETTCEYFEFESIVRAMAEHSASGSENSPRDKYASPLELGRGDNEANI